MINKLEHWAYGDHSYYITHILIGTFVMICVLSLLHFYFKQSIDIILCLVSNDTIELSASLLGFQLAGVSILISLNGNKKLKLLRQIESDTMIYKIFISSITMFLLSILLMLASLNFFPKGLVLEKKILYGKMIVSYGSIVTFSFGMVFLLSSIRLLKWFCSKK